MSCLAASVHAGPYVPWRTMNVPSRELTPEDLELIEFARRIVDAPDS